MTVASLEAFSPSHLSCWLAKKTPWQSTHSRRGAYSRLKNCLGNVGSSNVLLRFSVNRQLVVAGLLVVGFSMAQLFADAALQKQRCNTSVLC